MTINASIRKLVRQRANSLCEYCHSSEEGSTTRFTIDHGQPRSRDGSDDLNNLILACHRCDMRRHNFTTGIDPQTGDVVQFSILEHSPGLSIFLGLRMV